MQRNGIKPWMTRMHRVALANGDSRESCKTVSNLFERWVATELTDKIEISGSI